MYTQITIEFEVKSPREAAELAEVLADSEQGAVVEVIVSEDPVLNWNPIHTLTNKPVELSKGCSPPTHQQTIEREANHEPRKRN